MQFFGITNLRNDDDKSSGARFSPNESERYG